MIPVSNNQVIYNGDGQTTAFTYNFKILQNSDLHLTRVSADGTEESIVTDYYVDMKSNTVYYPGYAPGAEEPGTDTHQVLQAGEKLIVYREVPITQEDDMPEQWPFDVIENAFDKSCIIDQQLKGETDRTLKVSRLYADTFEGTFPVEAGKTIRFKDDGTGFELTDDPKRVQEATEAIRANVQALHDETEHYKDVAESAAKAAAEDAVADVDGMLLSTRQLAQQAIAAKDAAQTSEANAKVSEDSAKASELYAGTSASAAALSEANALKYSKNLETASEICTTKASEASASAAQSKTSETNAKASENAAKTSETNASSYASNASSSASAANSSASSAEYSYRQAAEQATSAQTSATIAEENKNLSAEYKAEALQSATNAEASATSAAESETNAKTSEELAKQYRDEAASFVPGNIVSRLDQHDREITAIKQLQEGINSRYETDSTEAYTKQILSGAKIFDLKKLGGKSVVVNQLQQMRMGTTSNNGITFTVNADKTEIIISGTATGLAFVSEGIDVIKDHKYFVKGCAKGGSTSTYMSYIVNSSMFNTSNAYYDVGNGNLITCLQSGKANYVYARVESGVTVNNLVFKPQCIDLTQMFGTGNEPTLEQCREVFSADYYPYNEGILLSVPVEQVVVKGKNLVNLDNSPYFTKQADGSYKANQVIQPQFVICDLGNTSQRVTVSGKIKCPVGKNYRPKLILDNDFERIGYITSTGDYVAFTLTSDSGRTVKSFNFDFSSSTDEIWLKDLQIEYGTVATTYSPYKENIIPVPASAKTDGLSAGTVANYTDLARKKKVKVIDRVDLGSLDWSLQTAQNRMYAILNSNAKCDTNTTIVSNALCGKYVTIPVYTLQYNDIDLVIGIFKSGSNNYVTIRDKRFTSSSAFKSAMQGVYLYYELAEPIETDIDIDNRFEAILCEGNGSITFENNSDYALPVMNEEEYVIKLSEV